MTDRPGLFDDAEVIHSYSRAEAIEDGFLIEAPEHQAQAVGFQVPVALTLDAWADCVAWGEHEQKRMPLAVQNEEGRLRDVLYGAAIAVSRAVENGVEESEARFHIDRVPADGTSVEAVTTELKIVLGPGDDGEAVFTIMKPNED